MVILKSPGRPLVCGGKKGEIQISQEMGWRHLYVRWGGKDERDDQVNLNSFPTEELGRAALEHCSEENKNVGSTLF